MSGDVSFEDLLGRLRRLGGVWEGDAAQATENESARPVRLQLSEAAFADQAASTVAQWAQDVRSTKGRMGEANSAAHAEIDAFLKNRNGRPVGYVTVLLAKWRTTMDEYDAELRGHVAGDMAALGFKTAPADQTRALTATWCSRRMGRHRIMGRAAVTDATPATVQASPPSPSAGAGGGALGIARSIPSMPAPHAGGGAATAGSTALLSSEGKLILFGWHRAVYAVRMERLADYHPVMYTGSESASAKAATIQRFLDGDARVLIMSLRSGAGIDGLQNVASSLMFGELDWSPGAHRQAIGRLGRRADPPRGGLLLHQRRRF